MSHHRTALRNAARELIWLAERCPDLFEHVLPIDEDTMMTLMDLADFDDEEPPDAAQ